MRLTKRVVPFVRSRMKRQNGTCPGEHPLPGTRFDESDSNATKRPSPEIATGPKLSPFAWTPPGPRSARVVAPVRVLRTKTSRMPFVSPATRFVAPDANTTKRPPSEIAIPDESVAAFASVPAGRDVHPGRVRRSGHAGRGRHRADDGAEHRDPPCCSREAHWPRLLERNDTKSRRPGRAAQPAPLSGGLPTRNRTTTLPARPVSFNSRRCHVRRGMGHHSSPWVQTTRGPRRAHELPGPSAIVRISSGPTRCGTCAQARTLDPAGALIRYRRITPAGSRSVNERA